MEICIREVKGYGWLARIDVDGHEVYRGEFQETPYIAMDKALYWVERLTT